MKSPFLLFVGIVLLSCTDQHACSCAAKPPVGDAFAEATSVFVGSCIEGKLVRRPVPGSDTFIFVASFTFEITRAWKGASDKKNITVETGLGYGDCGFPFQIGSSYLVYTNGTEPYQTNICTRSFQTGDMFAISDEGKAEMKALDEISETQKGKK